MTKYLRLFIIGIALLSFSPLAVFAQREQAEQSALLLLAQKDYDKALPMLHQLYSEAPFDKRLYDIYYRGLIEAKRYDTAISLGEYMAQIRREDLSVWVDIGRAHELKGNKNAAQKQYDAAIEALGVNEYQAIGLAAAFRNIDDVKNELKTYEHFRRITGNPYVFAYDLSRLYDKFGETDKALDVLLTSLRMQPYGMENAKLAMERLIDNQPKKMKKAEAAIAQRMKHEPNSYLWRELFTWLQSQKGNKSDQLAAIIKLDEEQQQNGSMVWNWAYEQYQKDEKELSLQAMSYLLKLPQNSPFRKNAVQLHCMILYEKLQQSYPVDSLKLRQLLDAYTVAFEDYADLRLGNLGLNYANILALYAHEPQLALDFLEQCIGTAYVPQHFVGEAKLLMGDFQVLLGNVWSAALLYSQVDKAFKEDRLGEEARFRNAKLSYFRGDFEYAQGQLSVLKASTTEFIANDALYLSVLITENTPEDKEYIGLKSFARAELLLFQHKYDEADQILDSLARALPEDELQDDIYMQRALIAMKKQDYDKAIGFLKVIQERFGDDVLADDATMRIARIYEEQYKDAERARSEYEKLIVDYPGSTFVQEARARYNALASSGT